jgi:hypothetical protein
MRFKKFCSHKFAFLKGHGCGANPHLSAQCRRFGSSLILSCLLFRRDATCNTLMAGVDLIGCYLVEIEVEVELDAD